MSRRTLAGLWKANCPQWVWIISPLWFGSTILALRGEAHDWVAIAIFLVTVTVGMGIAEFAGTYSDRDEDRLYGPTNPLATGELDAGTARKAFILQNVVAGSLGFALMLVTLNFPLTIAMIVGWLVGLSYSLPPFRFKETVAGPFLHGLGIALLPIFAWLVVAPLDSFVVAFSAFLLVNSFGFGITMKFRKTLLAYSAGLSKAGQGGTINSASTVGFKLSVRTATALEAIGTLGAYVLVPIFWYLGIFDSALSIVLLCLPFPLSVAGLLLRIRDPERNGERSVWLLGTAWILIIISLLAVAVASLVHWSFAVLICAIFVLVFSSLVRFVHPWGCKAPGGRERPSRQVLLGFGASQEEHR